MIRTNLINLLIKKRNYHSYLEIGVSTPELNYSLINCEHKECCDPYLVFEGDFSHFNEDGTVSDDVLSILTYHMKSDDMFAMMPEDKKFDLIFIDGLHTEEQVKRDIINSIKHLTPNGLVLCQDTLPPHEYAQIDERKGQSDYWSGTVWKAIADLNKITTNFTSYYDDTGIAIIPYQIFEEDKLKEYFKKSEYTFDMYDANKVNLMHMIYDYQLIDWYF